METEDDSVTPVLDDWTMTYRRSERPSFEFDVHVSSAVADLIGLENIHNDISITTTTPEIRDDNNQDDHTHRFILTDLEITKIVDQTAASAGDTLEYFLEYGNNGPNTASGTTVTDQLPDSVTFSTQTSGPAYDATFSDVAN